jgi:lysophospholipase L1-like esterase
MSEPTTQTPHARFNWILPAWFLGALILGLAALSLVGRRVARTDYHPGFIRFFPPTSPESNYFPTLNEMTAIVRGQCRPDQILVIVGGNSILQGVWQPAEEVWTKRLQQLLGDHYCVINFAFRGAGPANGGAVVAEVLRDAFPRQIYIANEAAQTAIESLGYDPYRYLTWQAYFAGKLINYPPRNETIARYRATPEGGRVLRDAAISSLFDRVLYYRDLWNFITFRYVCTIPSLYGAAIPDLLTPRSKIPDAEADATDPANVENRYPAAVFDTEMQIVRGFEGYSHRTADGHWVLAEATREDMAAHFAEGFPTPLKARTLMLISRSSPHYRRHLTPDEAIGEDQAYANTVEIWEKAGYAAMSYGHDFNEDDYGDRTHLSKLGGAKLADAVAPKVRAMAEQLGYLR